MMGTTPSPVVQVQLKDVKSVFGEKIWESIVDISKTLKSKFEEDPNFTGQINFTVNCKDGGIGNVSAHIPQKI